MPIDENRESARALTIIGLILSAKTHPTLCTSIGTGTHEVICPLGTILIESLSTAQPATS